MTRTRRGYIARRRRTKIRLFASSFRGAHSQLTRTITQQKIRALVSAHRDRDSKKRSFRRLWIIRINALIRERVVSDSYSRLIHNLHKRRLLLNRKILAQIAISNRNCLSMISNEIIKEVDYKESTGIIETEFPGVHSPGRSNRNSYNKKKYA
uniref:Large ribosomal subunit protein bL20c n=1 Tax=Amphidasya ambigua TaxID=61933 RepID=A0A6F8FED8_9GENT|nr:ribosomal protein L20 [Amphidasya ambigua]